MTLPNPHFTISLRLNTLQRKYSLLKSCHDPEAKNTQHFKLKQSIKTDLSTFPSLTELNLYLSNCPLV
jgi:hypothetical protein